MFPAQIVLPVQIKRAAFLGVPLLLAASLPALAGPPAVGMAGDVPHVDYAGIVQEVVSYCIGTLLFVAAAGIGLGAMFSAYRWVSEYLYRSSIDKHNKAVDAGKYRM